MISSTIGMTLSATVGMGSVALATLAQLPDAGTIESLSKWEVQLVMGAVALGSVYFNYRLSIAAHAEVRSVVADFARVMNGIGEQQRANIAAIAELTKKLEDSPCLLFRGMSERRGRERTSAALREALGHVERESHERGDDERA